MKPDFLPGGFSDDSFITPLLTLLGFLSVPVGQLKEARCIARATTCSFVCIALSGTVLLLPSEAASLFPETLPVQEVVSTPISCSSSAQAQLESACFQSVGIATVSSGNEFTDHEDFAPPEGEDKNKRLIAPWKGVPFTWLLPPASPLKFIQSRQIAIWAGAHGHQLQIYDSGDESDISLALHINPQTFFRPPCIQKGGLFHALRVGRLLPHSATMKTAKQFAFGSPLSCGSRTTLDQCSQCVALRPEQIRNPVKRWLLHHALLL